MLWSELGFGKHRGKTLPQVLFTDPDWFFWAVEEGVFEGRGNLVDEAELVEKRACHIRIPQRGDDQRYVAEYLIHPPTGKFSRVDVVPASRPLHQGSSPAFRAPCFDLIVPRRIAPYDKRGCASMLASLKYYLFGDSSYRMTRRRSEAFFSDPSNFEEE